MTSAEFKEAIRPFVRQFIREQVIARSTEYSVYQGDTQCKRNTSAVINQEFSDIYSEMRDRIAREREIYQ
ncbi:MULTISPECIES: hypothetical protein [Actinomycetes]|uniref:Uncharacterized protein n=1 Tax=Herbiconiux daphne TaxID=2970914 RepID=A0ABT2HCD0_9MICO|nr:hypothetical protein [Herbiconiux daphne]MCS5737544.1 hypothetical protein [Herbiconiux daphne]